MHGILISVVPSVLPSVVPLLLCITINICFSVISEASKEEMNLMSVGEAEGGLQGVGRRAESQEAEGTPNSWQLISPKGGPEIVPSY